MYTVNFNAERAIAFHGAQLAKVYRLRQVAQELGIHESMWGAHYTSLDVYSDVLAIRFDFGKNSSEYVKSLLEHLFSKRIAMPRTFIESSGRWMYKGEYQGVTIEIDEDAPACAVEMVEEEVEIPANEAHKEKRVRYKLVGEGCAEAEAAEEPVASAA